MVHITDLGFDANDLRRAVYDGQVTKRNHPTLPLSIYAYSDSVHFAQHWTPVTVNCRGLILDDDFNVVARPWKKFFNLGDKNAEFPWDAPAEVTDKMDGSLGILYRVDNNYHGHLPEGTAVLDIAWKDTFAIATKGSFTSDQALEATRILEQSYRQDYPNFEKVIGEYTFLFEIVYPQNRIVVHYGDTRDLFLLGAVHTERGYYLGPNEAAAILRWNGPVTKVMPARNVSEAIAAAERRNAEGVVIRSGNKMVKLKQNDYVEMHRIISNLSEKTIWEQMCRGKTAVAIVAPLPDEWHDWALDVYTKIETQYKEKANEIVDEFEAIEQGLDRKTFAMLVSKSPNRALLFKLYDGKFIVDDIMQSLKPKAESNGALQGTGV